MKRDVAQAIQSVEPGAGPDSFRAVIVCDAALRVFEGHFPGNPLVPGVMELEMLRTAYERFTGQRWSIARVLKAKFRNRILPGDTVLIEASTGPQDGGVRVKASLANAVPIAQIVVVLHPA